MYLWQVKFIYLIIIMVNINDNFSDSPKIIPIDRKAICNPVIIKDNV